MCCPKKTGTFDCMAPVNAPFSCPKSIDSNIFSGIAAQFTAMKASSFRDDLACKIFATTSLPVPVGPFMRTLALDPASLQSRFYQISGFRIVTR
jgi:hypothetical protein